MATAAFQSILPSIQPFRIPRSLQSVVGRVFGIDAIARVYDKIQKDKPVQGDADRLLEFLEISYTTSETDLARIPASGAAVVTVNHPFGILDGAILASLLTKIRPDVRFLANGILSMVPELREMVIPVDPTSGRSWTGLVRNRHAFRERLLNGPSRPALPNAEFDLDSTVVSDIEQKQTAVPVLLRQYLRLGGKLLGFNVDPKFADALDGLILLDLTKTKPKLLERYLGKTEATAFLEFQKGNVEHRNGTH